jgi:SPP1 gp7 family putative phage head morphogenesis protein
MNSPPATAIKSLGTRLSLAVMALFGGDTAVARTAFSAAFLRGADLDGPDNWGAGKLLRPYDQSAWVHRAVRLKVEEISRVPMKFYSGHTEFADPAFLEWWNNPFLTSAKRPLALHDVRRQLGSWPDLGGEFFILLGDDWLAPGIARRWQSLSRPIIARPDKMHHILSQGEIIGWRFCDAGHRMHDLLPEQVIHSPEWNPYDEFRGLATVRVVFNAAEADYLAGVYVRNLMRNNGDQGVYVIAKDQMLTDIQRGQLLASLREKRSRAMRGDFSAAFLTGDISVQDAKAQRPDADLNAGRILNRHEIFLGMGVPPSMADVKAAYSIGADSDRFTLITGSCMPLSAKIDAALSKVASLMLGRPIVAQADWDDHPVMQAVRRERIDTAMKLFSAGMPIKDANDYLDLGMKPYLGWERGYLPFNIAPVPAEVLHDGSTVPTNPPPPDQVQDPEFNEEEGNGPDDDDVKAIRLLVLARRRVGAAREVAGLEAQVERDFGEFQCECHGGEAGSAMKNRPASEVAQWRTLMAARRGTIKSFASAITRLLMAARVETLRRLESGNTRPDAVATVMFDVSRFALSFDRAMETQQKQALQLAGEQMLKELLLDDPFTYPAAAVLEFIKERKSNLKDVPQKTHDVVKAQLVEGIQNGETVAQLAARVRSAFNNLADVDANRIAMTETGSAYGAGRAQGMRQAGVRWKQWLTSGDSNVRPAHAKANGQAVKVSDPFIVDNEELDFPGDTNGSPGNVINCRCVSIAVTISPEATGVSRTQADQP